MQRAYIIILLITVISSNLLYTAPVSAQNADYDTPGFDPNRILSDDDIMDPAAMDKSSLTAFLASRGTLANLREIDIDGTEKSIPDIIWRVSQSYKINPKYLLALLQKEQSLVESKNPTQNQLDWATGYAVCDSCSKNDPDIIPFKGFANQLEWAAKQHREKYYIQMLATGRTISGKGIGISFQIDGQTIIPANNATAMLYTYTPHIHGNFNLWNIWQRWFSKSFPNGTLVRAKDSGIAYLIQNGLKRPFVDESVLVSIADPTKVVTANDTELASISEGEPMRYPKYSLLKSPAGKIYLLTAEGRRRIINMQVFRKYAFMEDDIIEVQDADLAAIPELEAITETTAYPQGALVKAKGSSAVYYVEAGTKYALPDEVFLKLYFTRRPIKILPQETIIAYTDGGLYRLHDGELVRGKTSPAVYVKESDLLRPIPSAEIFEKIGWKWQNVVTLPDGILALYSTSTPINLQNPGSIQLTAANAD